VKKSIQRIAEGVALNILLLSLTQWIPQLGPQIRHVFQMAVKTEMHSMTISLVLVAFSVLCILVAYGIYSVRKKRLVRPDDWDLPSPHLFEDL